MSAALGLQSLPCVGATDACVGPRCPQPGQGQGRQRENLGRLFSRKKGWPPAARARPPPPSLSFSFSHRFCLGSAVIEWIIASTYGVNSPGLRKLRLVHLIVDRHSRGRCGGVCPSEKEKKRRDGKAAPARVGWKEKKGRHTHTTHTQKASKDRPQKQPFVLVRHARRRSGSRIGR